MPDDVAQELDVRGVVDDYAARPTTSATTTSHGSGGPSVWRLGASASSKCSTSLMPAGSTWGWIIRPAARR